MWVSVILWVLKLWHKVKTHSFHLNGRDKYYKNVNLSWSTKEDPGAVQNIALWDKCEISYGCVYIYISDTIYTSLQGYVVAVYLHGKVLIIIMLHKNDCYNLNRMNLRPGHL